MARHNKTHSLSIYCILTANIQNGIITNPITSYGGWNYKKTIFDWFLDRFYYLTDVIYFSMAVIHRTTHTIQQFSLVKIFLTYSSVKNVKEQHFFWYCLYNLAPVRIMSNIFLTVTSTIVKNKYFNNLMDL